MVEHLVLTSPFASFCSPKSCYRTTVVGSSEDETSSLPFEVVFYLSDRPEHLFGD